MFGNSPEDIENITAALKAKTKQKRADSASPLTAGQFVQQLDQLTAEVVGGTTSASDAFQSILSALLNVQDKDSSISGRNVRENVGRILEKAALIKSDVYESVSGEFNRASMSSKNQNFTVNKLIEQVRKSLGQGVSIHRQKYQGMLSKIMSYFGFWHTIRNPKISRRIVFLGPPGAGKGTYATEITKKYGLAHISTGDLLRQEVAKKTDLGNNAKAFMESGQLVPDSLVQEILIQRFKQDDAKNGFILDGYPRNQAQAEALDAQLKENGQFIDFVLDLQASEATIVKRISGRRVCKICSATYHILNNPPKVGGVCDKDGGELSQRNDDKEGIVKNRIFVYNQATRPLLDYYHQQRKIYPLNANETLNVVVAGINKTVRDYDLNSIKKTVKELSVGVGQNEWVSIKQLLEKTGYPSTEIHKRSKEAVASLEAIEEIKRLESLLPAAASPLTLGNALNAIGNARAKLNKHHVKTIRDFSKVSLPDLITAVKSTAEEVERVGGIDSSKEKDKWLAIAKELLELQDIVSANMAAYKKIWQISMRKSGKILEKLKE